MITGHRSFFEERARERGYSLDQVMPCVVRQDGDEWTVDESHPAYPRPRGAGTKLKAILGWFWIRPLKGCKCEDRAMTMDQMGPQWCRDNLDTIVGWLREEASARGMPFVEFVAKQAVIQAINWADAQAGEHST